MKSISPYLVQHSGYGLTIKYLELERAWALANSDELARVTSQTDAADRSSSPASNGRKLMSHKPLPCNYSL